ALQHGDFGPTIDVPNVNRVVGAARSSEQVALRVEGHTGIDRVAILRRQLEMERFLGRRQIPKANRAVAAKCRHEFTSRVKRHRGHHLELGGLWKWVV